jgi:methionine-rich copper-binding protein CopC
MAWRPLAYSMAFLMCSAAGATAHSSLLEAVPHDGAVVAAGDVPIELRFDSRLDPRFSQLAVVKPDGSRSVLTLQVGDKPGILKATGTRLSRGSYLLHWRVLSVDGHADQGQISFEVRP